MKTDLASPSSSLVSRLRKQGSDNVPERPYLLTQLLRFQALCLQIRHAILERRYLRLQVRILSEQCQAALMQGRLFDLEVRYQTLNLEEFGGELPVLHFVHERNEESQDVRDGCHRSVELNERRAKGRA
jgi:hypothetical protein